MSRWDWSGVSEKKTQSHAHLCCRPNSTWSLLQTRRLAPVPQQSAHIWPLHLPAPWCVPTRVHSATQTDYERVISLAKVTE